MRAVKNAERRGKNFSWDFRGGLMEAVTFERGCEGVSSMDKSVKSISGRVNIYKVSEAETVQHI